MLNSPSDYEFVNVSNVGSFIHGQVLPVRYAASSTSGAATCAYEDYLYLLEAYYERANYDSQPTSTITPSSRVVVASAAEATTPTGSWLSRYINKSTVIPLSLVENTASSPYPEDAIDNKAIALLAPKNGSYYIRSKSTRRLEGWCRRFYDYHQLSRVCHPARALATCMEAASLTYRYKDSFGRETTNTVTFNVSSNTSMPIYVYSAAASNTETVSSTNITWKTSAFGTWPHATDAWLLVGITAQTRNGASTVSQYFTKTYQASISNGAISLPDSWDQSLAREVLAKIGKPYIATHQGVYGDSSNDATINIGQFAIIADFDFPADYSNWGWQPT